MFEPKDVDIVKVGIADMNIIKYPSLIRTSGLGSCVGVVIYDEKKELAGMAHVMLPDSSLARSGQFNIAKFADTAVKELVKKLLTTRCETVHVKSKNGRRAQMFQFTTGSDMMRIGPRNVEAIRKQLSDLNIQIMAEDVGGNSGRTIEFNPETCMLQIRTVNKGIKCI